MRLAACAPLHDVLSRLQRVDQQMIDARILQGIGQREPGGAGADDQHVNMVGQHRETSCLSI